MFFSAKNISRVVGTRNFFFTRKNGFSKGIYNSLNCGVGSKDDNKIVKKNIEKIAILLEIPPKNIIFVKQIHSNKIIDLDKRMQNRKISADGMITSQDSLALAILTADCVPILLVDKASNYYGAIHSGWKGANLRIIKNIITKFKNKKSKLKNLLVAIGPCIGADSYEVKNNFINKIRNKNKDYKRYFVFIRKKIYFNLRFFVEQKLLEHGVLKKNIEHINKDTYKDKKNFFSYRRSVHSGHKDYGRCISIIQRY